MKGRYSMSVLELTEQDFDTTIQNNGLVVVDFWAKWCGPCLAFAPVFLQVSNEFKDVLFAKVDIEECPQLADDFQIRSIPMLMIFKNNVAIFAQSGAQTAKNLQELIQKAKELDLDSALASIDKQSDKTKK